MYKNVWGEGKIFMAYDSIYIKWKFTDTQKEKLINNLLKCESIKKHTIRDAVFQKLPDVIYEAIEVNSNCSVHVFNTVKTCLDYPRGLEILIKTVCDFERGTWQEQELLKYLQDITSSPIEWKEIIELKRICRNIRISEDKIRQFYYQLPDNPDLPNDCEEDDMFMCLLDYFAQKSYSPPDKAPILEFLEACKSVITDNQTTEELNKWKQRVAQRLGIDLNAICPRVEKTSILPKQADPVLLIKIEPNEVNENKFIVTAWLFYDKESEEQFKTELGQNYTLEALEGLIPEILTKVAKKLRAIQKKLVLVEIMLPLQLFDWNINNINIKIGKEYHPLGSCYRLAIRSWDRFYNDEFIHAEMLKNSDQQIYKKSIYLVPEKCFPDTHFDLEESLVFLTGKPITGNKFETVMGCVLAAGIPFALWTLHNEEVAPANILAIIDENKWKGLFRFWKKLIYPKQWPKKIMQCRKQEIKYKKTKSEQVCLNINILCDHLERLPPKPNQLGFPK
jgi:hypothetical protein